MPFDFAKHASDMDMPNFDEPMEEIGMDPSDLETLASVMHQWADYLKLRADYERQTRRGNLAVADLIRRDMDRLYGELPAWARWERNPESAGKSI